MTRGYGRQAETVPSYSQSTGSKLIFNPSKVNQSLYCSGNNSREELDL